MFDRVEQNEHFVPGACSFHINNKMNDDIELGGERKRDRRCGMFLLLVLLVVDRGWKLI